MNSVQHSLLLIVCCLVLKCFVIWCFMHGWRCIGRMWEKLYFKGKKLCMCAYIHTHTHTHAHAHTYIYIYRAWLQNSLGWLAVVVCNKVVIITSEFEYFIWNCQNMANCCHCRYWNISDAHTIPDNHNTAWVPCHARYVIYFGQYVRFDVLTWMCLMLCITLC